MSGTVVNALAVVIGGVLGLQIKKGLTEELKTRLFHIIGVITLFIGLLGVVKEALVVDGTSVAVSGQMLLILSLVIGFVLGEILDIEGKIEAFGDGLKSRFGAGDGDFTTGFLSATLLICVGAMAIVGALENGLKGDPSTLYAKSVLDFISMMILSSTLGVGVVFSVIPLVIYQGGISLLAGVLAPYFSDALISDLSLVGNVLIFCIGLNLLFDKNIKVGNLLAALLVPVLYRLFF